MSSSQASPPRKPPTAPICPPTYPPPRPPGRRTAMGHAMAASGGGRVHLLPGGMDPHPSPFSTRAPPQAVWPTDQGWLARERGAAGRRMSGARRLLPPQQEQRKEANSRTGRCLRARRSCCSCASVRASRPEEPPRCFVVHVEKPVTVVQTCWPTRLPGPRTDIQAPRAMSSAYGLASLLGLSLYLRRRHPFPRRPPPSPLLTQPMPCSTSFRRGLQARACPE
mmetsp:Transcript_22104/g.71347  ORF Transcript_22104/g.71347 Transcript_22104/m.71347 type:complete len:223 (-) Transcript_22104:386-1054(-)